MFGKNLATKGVIAAALAMACASSAAAYQVLVFPTSRIYLSNTYMGAPIDTLTRNIDGNIAYFTLSGVDNETFSAPSGVPAKPGEVHPYSLSLIMNSDTASWNTDLFPVLTLWTADGGGGLTIGTQVGDHGTNLVNLFQSSRGTGQVYDFQPFASVPEPESWTLLLVGLGGLGAGLRRAKHRAARV